MLTKWLKTRDGTPPLKRRKSKVFGQKCNELNGLIHFPHAQPEDIIDDFTDSDNRESEDDSSEFERQLSREQPSESSYQPSSSGMSSDDSLNESDFHTPRKVSGHKRKRLSVEVEQFLEPSCSPSGDSDTNQDFNDSNISDDELSDNVIHLNNEPSAKIHCELPSTIEEDDYEPLYSVVNSIQKPTENVTDSDTTNESVNSPDAVTPLTTKDRSCAVGPTTMAKWTSPRSSAPKKCHHSKSEENNNKYLNVIKLFGPEQCGTCATYSTVDTGTGQCVLCLRESLGLPLCFNCECRLSSKDYRTWFKSDRCSSIKTYLQREQGLTQITSVKALRQVEEHCQIFCEECFQELEDFF